MRRHSVNIVLLGLVTLTLLAAWHWFAPPEVQIVQPTRGAAVEAVYATGLVEPSLEIRIAPRAAGRIIELGADEGDTVKKGQLLARLEDADLRASVAELEARVAYAKAQYDRNFELRRSALIAQDALDRSRTDLEAARATLKRARDRLAFMRLVAPADGRIIRRDGEVGEFIPVNQIVFYLSGPGPLRITSDVDEEDVPRVTPGQSVLIRADAFPDRLFEGQVEQVTPRGDPVERSYRVRITLTGDPPLQIGMTAETNIILAERPQALLIPASALVDGYVWVVQDQRAQRREVSTGVVTPDRVEIRDGLAKSEWLIVRPPESLEPGRRVRPRPSSVRTEWGTAKS